MAIFDPFDTTPQITGALSAVQIGIDTAQEKGELATQTLADQLDYLKDALASITELPAITGATLPDAPVHQVEAFQILGTTPVRPTDIDFTRPANPTITEINSNFPTDQPYESVLLTNVKSVLDGLINNFRQTGLNPVIEQQIWDKERERTTAVMLDAIDNETTQWSRSGWPKAQGPQFRQIQKLQEQKRIADITASRAIAVAQADLEQKNLHFSIQQAATLEGVLINAHVSIEQMLVESEKSRIQSLAEINKLNVDVFKEIVGADVAYAQGKMGLYSTDATVFGKLIDAESAKINAQIAIQGAEITYDSKKADLAIEVAKANIATMLAQKELSIGTIKAIATLLSQLVAAYGSSVNYGASISAGTSSSVGYSQSHSSSYPHAESPSTE